MPSGLKLDEMPLKPADAILLGGAQRGQAAVLRYPPGRGSVERLEAGCRQQVAEHDGGQLAVLVLQRHGGAVELDDRVDVLAERDPVPGSQHPCWFLRHAASRGSALAVRTVPFPSGRDRSPRQAAEPQQVEQHGQDPDRITCLAGGFGQRSWLSERADEQLLKVSVSEPGMPVAGQPPQVGGPDRVRLADQSELPAGHLAGGRGDRALVPEISVSFADRTAVGDDTAAVEHSAEKVRHMADLPFSGRPGQREGLSGDAGHPGVTVGLDDVMPLQPGLVDDMRPGGD